MTKRRGKRCKQLLDDLKETIGYWKLKEDRLARITRKRLWTCRQTDYGTKEIKKERRKEGRKEGNNELPSTTMSSDIS